MSTVRARARQVMDWRAALLAGLLAGIVMMGVRMLLWRALTGGSIWTPFHMTAAIVLGEEVAVPSMTLEPAVFIVGGLVHMALAVVYTFILAFIIHRWGLLAGIVLGALYGLALYAINYYTFSWLFPWFYPIRSWMAVLSHVIFGALAGGLYEAFERDIYEVELVTDQPDQAS